MSDAIHDPEFLNGFSLDDLLAAAANKARFTQRVSNDYEEENRRLRRRLEDADNELYELNDAVNHGGLKPKDLDRLSTVIYHLLHATGVYDLTDLKDAALDLGMEII